MLSIPNINLDTHPKDSRTAAMATHGTGFSSAEDSKMEVDELLSKSKKSANRRVPKLHGSASQRKKRLEQQQQSELPDGNQLLFSCQLRHALMPQTGGDHGAGGRRRHGDSAGERCGDW